MWPPGTDTDGPQPAPVEGLELPCAGGVCSGGIIGRVLAVAEKEIGHGSIQGRGGLGQEIQRWFAFPSFDLSEMLLRNPDGLRQAFLSQTTQLAKQPQPCPDTFSNHDTSPNADDLWRTKFPGDPADRHNLPTSQPKTYPTRGNI